jgi:hypothetical protein
MLATPIAELRERGRTAGVRWLGDLGNEDHLVAEPPEDHTPFSATAWPGPLPGYYVTAIDWADGPHSDRLLADARTGRAPWVKYLNFRGRNYSVRRDWEPRPNADGHLHISIRSDWCLRSIGAYNPFTPEVDDMTPDQAATLERVALTLGWLIQGRERTEPQPGLPPTMLFPIEPNRMLRELLETRDSARPVSLTEGDRQIIAQLVAAELAPKIPTVGAIATELANRLRE